MNLKNEIFRVGKEIFDNKGMSRIKRDLARDSRGILRIIAERKFSELSKGNDVYLKSKSRDFLSLAIKFYNEPIK